MGNFISGSFCGVCLIASISSSCGNGWLNAGAREETQVALIEKGDRAFGDRDYTKAAEHYEKALTQEAANDEVRVKLAFTYNSIAGLSVLDIAKRAILQTSDESQGAAGGANGGSFDIGSIQNILGLEGSYDCSTASSFEKIRTETNPTCTVTSGSYLAPTVLQATADEQLSALNKQLELYNKTYKTMCPALSGTLAALFENQGDLYNNSYQGSSCNQGIPTSDSFLGKFAISLALMTEASILYTSVITPLLNGVANVNTHLAAFNNPTCDPSPCSNAAATAVAKSNAFVNLLNTATPLMASLDSDTLDVTIKNFELVSALLSGDADFVKEMDLSSSVQEAKDSLNDIKAVVQTSNPTNIDNSTEEGQKAEQLQETRTKVKEQLLGADAENVPASQAGSAVDTKFQADTANVTPEEQKAKNCEMQNVCNNWESMGPLMYPGEDISEKPTSCSTTDVKDANCQEESNFLTLRVDTHTSSHLMEQNQYHESSVRKGITQFFKSIADNFKDLHKDL